MPEARTILAFTQRAAAHEVEKVLQQRGRERRVEPDLHWDGDELVVAAVYVDEGPTLKRWRARARGRVNQILKRTCHITSRSRSSRTSRRDGGQEPASGRGRGAQAAEQPRREAEAVAKKKEATA